MVKFPPYYTCQTIYGPSNIRLHRSIIDKSIGSHRCREKESPFFRPIRSRDLYRSTGVHNINDKGICRPTASRLEVVDPYAGSVPQRTYSHQGSLYRASPYTKTYNLKMFKIHTLRAYSLY